MMSVAYSGVRFTGPGTFSSRSSKPGIFSIRYGRSAKKAPPITRPARDRRPPTTVIVTKNRDSPKFHTSGGDRLVAVGDERSGQAGHGTRHDEREQGGQADVDAERGRHARVLA